MWRWLGVGLGLAHPDPDPNPDPNPGPNPNPNPTQARVALGRALFMDPRPGKRAAGGQMLTSILHEDMEDDLALQACRHRYRY